MAAQLFADQLAADRLAARPDADQLAAHPDADRLVARLTADRLEHYHMSLILLYSKLNSLSSSCKILKVGINANY